MNNTIYETYANNELWDETSCPFGTQVLKGEAYDINQGELDIYELCTELKVNNVTYTDSKREINIEMSWEAERPSDYGCKGLIYVYDGYVYYIKTAYSGDGYAGFAMTREPQFYKNYSLTN